MGGLFFGSVDAIALVSNTAKTVLELGAGAGPRVRIKEWWLDFDGVTPTNAPVKVELGRFSAGVTTATGLTVEKLDTGEGAPGVTAKHTATVEGAGTADDILIFRVPPTSGRHYVAPLGQEFVLAASGFWRMRLTAPGAAVNACVGVIWEE